MSREQVRDSVLEIYKEVTQGRSCTLAERLQKHNPSRKLKMSPYFQKSSKKNWFEGIEPHRVYEITGKAGSGKTHFCH